MNKKGYLLISSSIILLLIIVGSLTNSRKDLNEILTVDIHRIDKILMDTPLNKADEHITSDEKKINELLHYLQQFKYQPIKSTAYMPMKAGIIYLYQEGKTNFIVYYGKEVMINQQLYRVIDGEIDDTFMQEYYQSI